MNRRIMLRCGIAVLVALVGRVAGPPGRSARAQSPARVFELEIANREIAGGEDVVRVGEGDNVEIRVSTDEPLGLHLHGYDLEAAAAPDAPTILRFEAYASGRFPVSSHGFGEESHGGGHGPGALFYVEVHPR